jgi:hypothetical protein
MEEATHHVKVCEDVLTTLRMRHEKSDIMCKARDDLDKARGQMAAQLTSERRIRDLTVTFENRYRRSSMALTVNTLRAIAMEGREILFAYSEQDPIRSALVQAIGTGDAYEKLVYVHINCRRVYDGRSDVEGRMSYQWLDTSGAEAGWQSDDSQDHIDEEEDPRVRKKMLEDEEEEEQEVGPSHSARKMRIRNRCDVMLAIKHDPMSHYMLRAAEMYDEGSASPDECAIDRMGQSYEGMTVRIPAVLVGIQHVRPM